MTENANMVMREYKIITSRFGDPLAVIPQSEMERLCEHVAKLEAENVFLREEIRALKERAD